MRRADRKAVDAALLDLFAKIGEAERVGYQTGFTHPTTQHIPETPYDMWWPNDFDEVGRLTRFLLIEHWRHGFAKGRAVRTEELQHENANTEVRK